VHVLRGSLKLQDERYRDVKGKFDAGLANPLAVSQTEAQVAQTRTTLISAHNDVLQARLRLALLTAAELKNSPLDDSYNPPEKLPLADLIARASTDRGDLQAAENAVTAARHDVQVAIGQYYPSITFDITAYLYRETVPDERKWDALLGLNLPIFSAGRIEADVRTAWSNLRQALLARSRTYRTVRSEVEQTYQTLLASEARLAQLQVQVEVAQQALDQAEQLYRAGRATNLDRVQAQDALLQAQLQQASETYDRKLFYLTLLQRAGLLREQFAADLPAAKRSD
jgi:adhesin transport system outer membrane protein